MTGVLKKGGGEGTGGGRKEKCEVIIKSESSNEENKLPRSDPSGVKNLGS